MSLPEIVTEAVRSVLGDGPCRLHEPLFGPEEQVNAAKCIASGHLSAGQWVEQFEAKLCEATGGKYAVATSSGTAALQVAIGMLWPKGSTIRIPALTFTATATAAIHAGMLPHFAEAYDVDLPVDFLGERSIANGRLRDSAQALGAELSGARVYSFNQNKTITTGGGGALVTDDEGLAKQFRHLITTARLSHQWEVAHDAIGHNYRMPDLNAAIGCAQLDRLPHILKCKAALQKRYKAAFDSVGGYWLNTIRVDAGERDGVLAALHDAGYQARCLPTPLHMLDCYTDCGRDDLASSEAIWRMTICLPSSPKHGEAYV